jgi:hypothetical protein
MHLLHKPIAVKLCKATALRHSACGFEDRHVSLLSAFFHRLAQHDNEALSTLEKKNMYRDGGGDHAAYKSLQMSRGDVLPTHLSTSPRHIAKHGSLSIYPQTNIVDTDFFGANYVGKGKVYPALN